MNILVTYDVNTETSAGRRRLFKVAQTCKNFGQRVQYSVFECRVDEAQYEELSAKLQKIINPKSDSLRVYRLRGERGIRIMVWEILPNITGPIMVEATVRLAYAIFTATTISFLGLGLQDPSPDWGLQIANGRAYLQVAWWMVIFPAAALATLVVGVNLVADGLKRVVDE